VQEGIKEQQRLVSQTEIVQTATGGGDPADRLGAREADRLRGECDIYVDSKLAEFEDFLNGTLRSGGPRPSSAAHRRRNARLRGTLAPAGVAVGLTFMATHANAAARRGSRSPLVINIPARPAGWIDADLLGDGCPARRASDWT